MIYTTFHSKSSRPLPTKREMNHIYLVAYVAETFGAGKKKFFQYVKENGISQRDNTAQAIWQVGKGDGIFLDILNDDGTIKDEAFMEKWIDWGGVRHK